MRGKWYRERERGVQKVLFRKRGREVEKKKVYKESEKRRRKVSRENRRRERGIQREKRGRERGIQ